jgi:hypothetical protein
MGQGTKGRREARTLTTIEERYNTDRQGPRPEEEDGRQHRRIREGRAEILKYGVTMYRNDVLWIAPM